MLKKSLISVFMASMLLLTFSINVFAVDHFHENGVGIDSDGDFTMNGICTVRIYSSSYSVSIETYTFYTEFPYDDYYAEGLSAGASIYIDDIYVDDIDVDDENSHEVYDGTSGSTTGEYIEVTSLHLAGDGDDITSACFITWDAN